MEFWQKVHWFTTPNCTRKCRMCFRPIFKRDNDFSTSKKLARILSKNVKEIVFGGGEPLMFGGLDNVIEILHNSKLDISIHTNADLLTPKRLEYLTEKIDEIAIPLDSLHPQTQTYLRGSGALTTFKKAFERLQDTSLRIGIHTVATAVNIYHLPAIYQYLKQNGKFDVWSIYEFNENLIPDRFSSAHRVKEIEKLVGLPATLQDGGVNCLLAKFILLEKDFARDKKVRFAAVKDCNRNPYIFVNSRGDVLYTNWFSQSKRILLGNVITEGFEAIKRKALEAESNGPLFNEELFIETEQDSPLWARCAWHGNYLPEELENINPRYYKKFSELTDLYKKRLIKHSQ